MFPEFAAGRGIETKQGVFLNGVPECVKSAIGNDHSGETGTHVCFPHLFRLSVFPRTEPIGVPRYPIEMGTAVPRPVRDGLRRAGEGEEQRCGQNFREGFSEKVHAT